MFSVQLGHKWVPYLGFTFCTVCRFQDEEISRSHIVAASSKWVGIDPKMHFGGRDQVGFSLQMVSSVSENTISVPWTETHNNNTGTTHFLMIDKKHLWLFALFVQLFSSYLKSLICMLCVLAPGNGFAGIRGHHLLASVCVCSTEEAIPGSISWTADHPFVHWHNACNVKIDS